MEKGIVSSIQSLYKVEDSDRIFGFSLPPQRIVAPPEPPTQTMLETSESIVLPQKPQPGECCGQSCPNCVWMEYVGEMKSLVEKGLMDKDQLLTMVKDLDVVPAVKAFLKMEINSWKWMLQKKESTKVKEDMITSSSCTKRFIV